MSGHDRFWGLITLPFKTAPWAVIFAIIAAGVLLSVGLAL